MTEQRRAEELYHAALERPEPEREAFLSAACGSDAALFREVQSLLGYAEQARRLMDEPVAAAATARLSVAPGARLGPYEVAERIGAGGMGEVYRARDTRLGRDVAVKVLPEAMTGDADALARFQREARAIAALDHPNVCALHDVGRHEGIDYLVMELLEGETLARRLERGPLPVEEALRTGVEIAEALEAAHARGIVHRDLKPANVLISPRGHAKVMDFGLARTTASGSGESEAALVSAYGTRDGVILGTAAYMSPEQARGQAVDARADVWALGCVLYEALTGRRAFGGRTISDTLAAVLEREVDWAALPPSTPAEVRSLLRRCLRKDRERRLRDVGDARIELEDAVRTAPEAAPGATPPRSWRKVLLPVAALAALVGVGWGLLTWREPPSPAEKSVAVLPLVAIGGEEGGDEYFSTGLTEDIVTHLTRIPELEVASSRSSLRYRETDKSLREIGQELGVATLLMGRVRRQSDRVKVNLALIDARTNRNLWADAFEGPLSDIFTIQNEIAEKLAASLSVELEGTKSRTGRSATADAEAYELVLRGRYLRNRETVDDLVNATPYLERATELAPGYALAWALLGDVYFLRGFIWAEEQARPGLYEQAGAAVERALELEPGLAYAHLVKGLILAHAPPRDRVAGEWELRRAIELDPRFANAHRELGVLRYRTMGKVDDALDAYAVADELEPFWTLVKGLTVEAQLAKGDLVSAHETAREARELDHPYWGLELSLMTTVAFQDFSRAESSLRRLFEARQANHQTVVLLLLTGRADEARSQVERLLRFDPNRINFEGTIRGAAGVMEIFAGNYASAARHLERAIELRVAPVAWGTWGSSSLYTDFATLLGYALLKQGETDRADRLFDETERFYTDRIAGGDTTIRARVGIAAVHAVRGDREGAYRWLEHAIDAGFYQYAELEPHPCFESLRNEERFKRMMRTVADRVEEMRRRADAAETP